MPNREEVLLQRITVNPAIFGGKPIVRGRRLAVEHVLGMLAAGDSVETLLSEYPWLESDDVRACLLAHYGAALADGAIVTAEPTRTRIRPSSRGEA